MGYASSFSGLSGPARPFLFEKLIEIVLNFEFLTCELFLGCHCWSAIHVVGHTRCISTAPEGRFERDYSGRSIWDWQIFGNNEIIS